MLKSAIQGLFDADDAARILWIADSWIAVNQNKEVQHRAPEPHWWRGMIREQQGDAASALPEYVQVTQLAPQFGYAFKRIARIQAQLGDAAKARVAFATAQRLIADDPELEVIAKEIASASPTAPEVKPKT